jgi:hypothetical protein
MTKKEDEETPPSNPEDLKNFVDETARLHLTENDLKKLEETLLNPPKPNDTLKSAAEYYKMKTDIEREKRGELLADMMKNDQELGLYDEPFDSPMIKEETSDWDVTLMDGLEDEEPFFTEEEIEKILQEEPTEEEVQRNFSTIEPETENIFHKDEFVPSMSDEEIMEMNQREYERDLDTEEDFDGFVPEPFATPEEVKEFKIDENIDTSSENEDEKKN